MRSLLKNRTVWWCTLIAAVTAMAPRFGIKLPNVPLWGAVILGVLVGALFAAVTLVLTITISSPVMAIRDQTRKYVDQSIPTLRHHVELVLGLYFAVAVAGVWPDGLYALLPDVLHREITMEQTAYFVQASGLLLSACSTMELARGTFYLLQARWTLLKQAVPILGGAAEAPPIATTPTSGTTPSASQ